MEKTLTFKYIDKNKITKDRTFPTEAFDKDKIGVWLEAHRKMGISPLHAKLYMKNTGKKGILKKLSKKDAQNIANEMITKDKYVPLAFQNIPFEQAINFFHQTKRRKCIVKTRKGPAVRYWILRLFKRDIIAFEESRKVKYTKMASTTIFALLGLILMAAGIYVHFFSYTRTCNVYHNGNIIQKRARAYWHEQKGWSVKYTTSFGEKIDRPLELNLNADPPHFAYSIGNKTFQIPAIVPPGTPQVEMVHDIEALPFNGRLMYRKLLRMSPITGISEKISLQIENWKNFQCTMQKQYLQYGEPFAPPLNKTSSGKLKFFRSFWFYRGERFTVEQMGSWPKPTRKWPKGGE